MQMTPLVDEKVATRAYDKSHVLCAAMQIGLFVPIHAAHCRTDSRAGSSPPTLEPGSPGLHVLGRPFDETWVNELVHDKLRFNDGDGPFPCKTTQAKARYKLEDVLKCSTLSQQC